MNKHCNILEIWGEMMEIRKCLFPYLPLELLRSAINRSNVLIGGQI